MRPFINDASLADSTWQAFERSIYRLLVLSGFSSVRLVGRSGDGGADIVASQGGERWLFQVKKWATTVGHGVIDETLEALRRYEAKVPVIVSSGGFEPRVHVTQRVLLSEGIPLQLWTRRRLLDLAARLPVEPLVERETDRYSTRLYQEEAVREIVRVFREGFTRRGLIVMATGLGKTFVAAEAVRRIDRDRTLRAIVLAHTNDLVYQLERSFWPFLESTAETLVWNGYEKPKPEALRRAQFLFACVDTLASAAARGEDLIDRSLVIVDECHHAASPTYRALFERLQAGEAGGPFLLGLTATPYRGDDEDISDIVGQPLISIDIVTGMRNGFLANVDYRMYTTNIDWSRLAELRSGSLTPRAINRTLFINEWDDAVVIELKRAWAEHDSPKALVFCGTIEHALQMRDRINSLGFCSAAALFSNSGRQSMKPWERNRILSDFEDGKVATLCVVDIFNEGIDVPDVNIIVFQRVSHSRRIFVQQLGRGLRIAPGKDKVIVLDFVSDVRRFAAGIELKNQLESAEPGGRGKSARVRIQHTVEFRRVGGSDPRAETFLRQWLDDVTAIEDAGENSSVLRYPPELSDEVDRLEQR